jgi:hypothetical protein
VIADEHGGLIQAVRRHLPEARRQRCTVHLERNVLTKVPQRLVLPLVGLSPTGRISLSWSHH